MTNALKSYADRKLTDAFENFRCDPKGRNWTAMKIAMVRYQCAHFMKPNEEDDALEKALLLRNGESWEETLRLHDRDDPPSP